MKAKGVLTVWEAGRKGRPAAQHNTPEGVSNKTWAPVWPSFKPAPRIAMADNPEFTDALERETREAIGSIISRQDWEEEDKERLHEEYMTEFGVVLREMMPMMLALFAGKKPTVAENTNDDDGEALEEAKVRYEATLIALTKKRKQYPQYLSQLLGKTTRIKENTAAVMRVDEPLADPMEGVGTVDLEDSYAGVLEEETSDDLRKSTHSILTDIERLSGMVNFAKASTQMDPFSSLFADVKATKQQ